MAEGDNHKIKVIKGIAYGFRDGDCCFLRIRLPVPDWVKNKKKRPRYRGRSTRN